MFMQTFIFNIALILTKFKFIQFFIFFPYYFIFFFLFSNQRLDCKRGTKELDNNKSREEGWHSDILSLCRCFIQMTYKFWWIQFSEISILNVWGKMRAFGSLCSLVLAQLIFAFGGFRWVNQLRKWTRSIEFQF